MPRSSLERLPATEPCLQVIPMADLGLVLEPAEIHLAPVANGGEVHQAAVQVAEHDLRLLQPGQRITQLDERLRDHASRRSAAVLRAGLAERLARLLVTQPRAGGA